MGFFTNHKLEHLQDLLVHELEDLYDAETRLIDALPKMKEAAHDPQLKQAIGDHLAQTRGHVQRLESVFHSLGTEANRETCEAMKGLIAEGQEMIEVEGDDAVRDAALIAAAQRVEHYEMAGYGTVRSLAKQLGLSDVAQILQQTLDEEHEADRHLTQIAEESVNMHAAT
ncbi:MAG: ferritin-like domain-containing protein [Phycisphaeraceae bacterium]|nr:ferritin-like domain-containing protein [Phycisphaeraceae bacterium]